MGRIQGVSKFRKFLELKLHLRYAPIHKLFFQIDSLYMIEYIEQFLFCEASNSTTEFDVTFCGTWYSAGLFHRFFFRFLRGIWSLIISDCHYEITSEVCLRFLFSNTWTIPSNWSIIYIIQYIQPFLFYV